MPDTFSRGQSLFINSLLSLSMPISDITNDDNSYSILENKVRVSDLQSVNVNYKQGKTVDSLALSKQWMILLGRANNTVQKTTQYGIRTVMNPHISRRYPTNDQMMRYPCLPHTVFTDTIIYGTVSKRGNNIAQFYGISLFSGNFCFQLN